MFRLFKTLAACLLAAVGSIVSAPLAEAQVAFGLNEQLTNTYVVTRAEREVLVFQNDLLQGPSQAQPHFNAFARFDAATPAHTHLGPVYNRVHVVRGASATRARLVSKLREIASQPGVKAVDLFFITHELGLQHVAFADQRVHIITVKNDLVFGLPFDQAQKLRMVYSTAAFSGMYSGIHWFGAGFKLLVGPNQICADTATSYAHFLRAWATGFPIEGVVNRSNNADPLRLRDNAAKVLLRYWNYATAANLLFAWSEVDSKLLIHHYSSRVHELTIHRMLNFPNG